VRTMARRKAKRGGRRAKSIPIAPIIPGAVVLVRAAQSSGSIGAKANYLSMHLTGMNIDSGDFNASTAMPFWIGTVAGVVVHKAANKIGINNYVRRASMGFLSL